MNVRELSLENLNELKIDENILKTYNPKLFELKLCYKFNRNDLWKYIEETSTKFEFNNETIYFLSNSANFIHLLQTMQWFVVRKEKEMDNVYREANYFVAREFFLNNPIFTLKTKNLLFQKGVPEEIDLFNINFFENKDLNKLIIPYKDICIETLLPGGIQLKNHILYLLEAFYTKNSDYELLQKYLNKN